MTLGKIAPLLKNHSLVSIFALVASKLVYLFTTLVLTNFMSVDDFGIVSVFMSYVALFLPIVTLNIYSGFGRYLYDESFTLNNQVVNTLGFGILIISLFAAIMMLIPNIQNYIFLPMDVIYFLIIVITGLFFEFLLTQYFIYNKNSLKLLKVILTKSILVIIVSIYFLNSLTSNLYMAIVYAEVVGTIYLFIYFINQHRPYTIKVDFSYLKNSLSYALPLIMYGFAMSALSQSDRIIILRLDSELSAGLYSMAYNLGSLILIISSGLLNANNPRFYELCNNSNHKKIFEDSKNISNIVFIGVLFVILYLPTLSELVLSNKYLESFKLIGAVGIVCFTHLFFQLWVRILSFEKRTVLIAISSLLAFSLNIYLNILLIPLFGYEIAILTTLISYFCMNVFISFFIDLDNKVIVNAFIDHFLKLAILISIFFLLMAITNLILYKFLFIAICTIIIIKYYAGIISFEVK